MSPFSHKEADCRQAGAPSVYQMTCKSPRHAKAVIVIHNSIIRCTDYSFGISQILALGSKEGTGEGGALCPTLSTHLAVSRLSVNNYCINEGVNTVLLQSRLRFAQKLIYHILKELGSSTLKGLDKTRQPAQRNKTSTAFFSKHFCLAPKCDKKSTWRRMAANLCGFPEPWGIKKPEIKVPAGLCSL